MNYFDPSVDDTDVKAVGKRYGKALLAIRSPVMGTEKIEKAAPNDEHAQRVMRKMDALRIFSDDLNPQDMGAQAVAGYVADTRRGRLGLVKAEQMSITRQRASSSLLSSSKTFALPLLLISFIVVYYLRFQGILITF